MPDHSLTLRAATPSDADALSRLAALDRRGRPRGRALLAERDGVAVAALALTSGKLIADPLAHTADAARALRRRRYQLLRQGGDMAPASTLLRRLAPHPAAAAS